MNDVKEFKDGGPEVDRYEAQPSWVKVLPPVKLGDDFWRVTKGGVTKHKVAKISIEHSYPGELKVIITPELEGKTKVRGFDISSVRFTEQQAKDFHWELVTKG